MRNALVRLLALSAVFLLGACGGGGGGGSSPEPTPPPPPAPTAFPLNNSAAFQPIAATRIHQGTATDGTVSRHLVSGRSAAVTINYNAANGSYTVTDGSASVSFDPPATNSGYIDSYSKVVGTVSDRIDLYNNVRAGASQAGAPIQLTYLSYGIWTHVDSATAEKRKTFLLFGYPTSSAEMPRTGSATYQTAVTGHAASIVITGGDYDIGGSAIFSADFGTGSVSTALTLGSLGTFNGTGQITGNQFGGTFSSSDPLFHKGDFAGGFFGPSAAEMGYGFAIKYGSPDPYAGASCCPPPLAWIVGTVVGKKN